MAAIKRQKKEDQQGLTKISSSSTQNHAISSDVHENEQRQSSFMDLAPEVRNMIYKYIFRGARIEVGPRSKKWQTGITPNEEDGFPSGILKVSSLIRHEAITVAMSEVELYMLHESYPKLVPISIIMSGKWRSSIRTVKYESLPRQALDWPLFKSLKTIELEHKVYHAPESDGIDSDQLEEVVMANIRRHDKYLVRHGVAGLKGGDVAVQMNIWVLNATRNISIGWQVRLDIRN